MSGRLDRAWAAMNEAKYAYEEASAVWAAEYNRKADTVGCITRSVDAAKEHADEVAAVWGKIYHLASLEWHRLAGKADASRISRIQDTVGPVSDHQIRTAAKERPEKRSAKKWAALSDRERHAQGSALFAELQSLLQREAKRDRWR